MPKLTKLPSLSIIHGFRGILDFYLWKGIPCVRKWPVTPKSHLTKGTMTAAKTFGAIIKAYALVDTITRDAFTEDAQDHPRTARDIYVSATLGKLHKASMSDFKDLAEEMRDSLANLEQLLHALGTVDTDDVQVDVITSGLPSGAATDDKLDDIISILAAGAPFAIAFIIDGATAAITTGQKGHLHIPFACTIKACTMLADRVGSIVVDIWRDSYANYPPTVADSITAAAKPTISADDKSQDTTLTGWSLSINAGDALGFNVDSCTDIQLLTISLNVTKD